MHVAEETNLLEEHLQSATKNNVPHNALYLLTKSHSSTSKAATIRRGTSCKSLELSVGRPTNLLPSNNRRFENINKQIYRSECLPMHGKSSRLCAL